MGNLAPNAADGGWTYCQEVFRQNAEKAMAQEFEERDVEEIFARMTYISQQIPVDLRLEDLDIGEFFAKMVQYKKNDVPEQIPVQEILDGIDDERLQRFGGIIPKPKTLNEAFGDLEDFQEFIRKRSQPIQELCNFHHNNIDFYEMQARKASTVLDGIKKEGQLLSKNYAKKAESIVKTIEDGALFGDFDKAIISAYTDEGFLYNRINKLLREENWDELDNLLPYIYFLLKAILYESALQVLEPIQEDDPNIILYRGTFLSKEQISEYESLKSKYFSWNGFTSTTKNKEVAEFFCIYPQDGFFSVIFVVDAGESYKRSNRYFDISTFSFYPEEDEVLLMPGTVFQVMNVKKKSDKWYIDLRIEHHTDNVLQQGFGLKGKSIINLLTLEDAIQNKNTTIELSYSRDSDLSKLFSLLMAGKDFITRINMHGVNFTATGMTYFMKIVNDLPHIDTLCVRDTTFSTESARIFFQALPKTKIKTLGFCIDGNYVNRLVVYELIANNAFQNLEVLELDTLSCFHNLIPSVVTTDTLFGFRNPFLHRLGPTATGHDLKMVLLQEMGFPPNADIDTHPLQIDIILTLPYIFKTKIKKLTLTSFEVNSNRPFEKIGSYLANSKIEELIFYKADINDTRIAILAKYIVKTNIRHLGLYYTSVEDAGLKSVVELLLSNQLETLALHDDSKITSKGISYLTESLLKVKLKRLDLNLDWKNIAVLKSFTENLPQIDVQDLSLSGNYDDDAIDIFEAITPHLSKTKFDALKISQKRINVTTLCGFITALPQTEIVFLVLGLGLYKQLLSLEYALTLQERDMLFKTLFTSLPLTKIKTFSLDLEPAWHPHSSQIYLPDRFKDDICVPENDVYMIRLSQFMKEQNISRAENVSRNPLIWEDKQTDERLRRSSYGTAL